MNFLTTKEIAEKWGVSQRRVLTLCESGRIKGAKKGWLIPEDAEKPMDARTAKESEECTEKVKPFLKWVGGKGQLIDKINDFYPFDDPTITKYAEPFVGGGAVLFDVLSKFKLEQVFVSDINYDLINAYIVIQRNVSNLIEALAKKAEEYLPMPEEERAEYYYKAREQFNYLKQNTLEEFSLERATLMIFLNKTCYNGMYRVNKKGLFNVPKGYYKNPLICNKRNLLAVSNALQDVEIICGDYHQSERFIDNHTFVYMDPPYRPLAGSANFNEYSEIAFHDKEQIELSNYVKELDERGAKILLSNSDPTYADSSDDFFNRIYEPLTIVSVDAKRMINSNGDGRGKITELLISNY